MSWIGFDMDGVITKAPEVFAVIAHAFKAVNMNVAVITYRLRETERAQTIEELRSIDFPFDRIVMSTRAVREQYGLDAAPWKAAVARDLGVKVMFEDTVENLQAMSPDILKLLVLR